MLSEFYRLLTLKPFFAKLKIWYLQHFFSRTACWFALKFLRIVQYTKIHKMNTPYFVVLIGYFGNRKNAVFLVTMATITQIVKSSVHFAQNNKLINLNKFQAKLKTLTWDKMSQSAFSVPVASGIAYSKKGKDFSEFGPRTPLKTISKLSERRYSEIFWAAQ